jgi:hypothetical protein
MIERFLGKIFSTRNDPAKEGGVERPKPGRFPLEIIDEGMWPLMRKGRQVSCRRAESSEIAKGDVVAFFSGGNLVVRRVISCPRDCGGWFLLRGDNCLRPEPVLHPSLVIGIVSSSSSKFGLRPPERILRRIGRWNAAARFIIERLKSNLS